MLTRSQTRTLEFLKSYWRTHGHAPTLAEIAQGIGIRSRGVVHRYLQALEAAGEIEILGGRHRGIRLIEDPDGPTPLQLPLYGKIAAGRPIEAIAGEDRIDLPGYLTGNTSCYALRVEGDSMIDIGIHDGDIVIIRPTRVADDGAIVVALIDGQEATLKRLRRETEGTVTLIPENASMAPMIYDARRVEIQGILTGQLRSYLR